MLVIGSLLALISGMFNAAAAALEKREGMRTAPSRRGMRLLAALARRPLWLLAMGLSSLAWVAEAASLTLAPVPVTATLRNAGRGLLVVGGGRWLGERFSRLELLGVAMASAGGVLTAISVVHSKVTRALLSNLTQLTVGAICMLAAAIVAAVASRVGGFARDGAEGANPVSPGRQKAAGVAMGAAVGLLFAGTGVFTKEVGDRFAVYGFAGGLKSVALSVGTWLMIIMSIWAQSLLQQAFRHANAASVSAVNACVASLGLIGFGFVLYNENVPRGFAAALLIMGIVVALVGTALLLAARPLDAPADKVGLGDKSNDGDDGEGKEPALHQGNA